MEQSMGITFAEVQSVEEDFSFLEKYQPGFSQKYLLSIDTAPLRRPLNNAILTTVRSEVLGRLLGAIAEATELSAKITDYEITEMNAEYERVGQQARAAKKAYDRLTPKITQHERFAADSVREYKRESLELDGIKADQPSEWDFPTRSEKVAYDKRLKAQQEKVDAAREYGNEVQTQLATLQAEQNGFAESYNALAKQYATLMNRLAILQGNSEGAKGRKVRGQYLFQR